jgi:cytochrome bd-type quinol oxidase subunit 2
MDVLKIVGIILVIVVVMAAVYGYDEYIKNRFNSTIFQIGRVVFFVIAEGCALVAYAAKQDMRKDNFLALLGVAAVIFIICLVVNIRAFGILHGIIITLIQSIAALIILAIILLLLFGGNESKNKKRR